LFLSFLIRRMGNCFEGAAKPLKDTKKPAPTEAPKQAPKAPAAVEKKEEILPPAPAPVPVSEKEPAPVVPEPAPVAAVPEAVGEQLVAPTSVQQLGVDSCLEVYSNSYEAWCPGVIQDMDSTSVFVAYQVPGDPAESLINTKGLPIDSPELKCATDDGAWLGASVEIFSASQQCWCMGKITELSNGVATAIYQYPGAAPESDPIMKQLELGNPDLQLPGAKNALQYRQQGELPMAIPMTVGQKVEVFSNSLGVWCPGTIQEVHGNESLSVAFHYPDMDPSEQPVLKELPIGHQDVRMASAETFNHTPLGEADLVQGIAVEVYSESRQFWILAHVKEVKEGLVTVLMRYPDMPPDSQLFEKVLPVGHVYIRLPEGDSSAA